MDPHGGADEDEYEVASFDGTDVDNAEYRLVRNSSMMFPRRTAATKEEPKKKTAPPETHNKPPPPSQKSSGTPTTTATTTMHARAAVPSTEGGVGEGLLWLEAQTFDNASFGVADVAVISLGCTPLTPAGMHAGGVGGATTATPVGGPPRDATTTPPTPKGSGRHPMHARRPDPHHRAGTSPAHSGEGVTVMTPTLLPRTATVSLTSSPLGGGSGKGDVGSGAGDGVVGSPGGPQSTAAVMGSSSQYFRSSDDAVSSRYGSQDVMARSGGDHSDSDRLAKIIHVGPSRAARAMSSFHADPLHPNTTQSVRTSVDPEHHNKNRAAPQSSKDEEDDAAAHTVSGGRQPSIERVEGPAPHLRIGVRHYNAARPLHTHPWLHRRPRAGTAASAPSSALCSPTETPPSVPGHLVGCLTQSEEGVVSHETCAFPADNSTTAGADDAMPRASVDPLRRHSLPPPSSLPHSVNTSIAANAAVGSPAAPPHLPPQITPICERPGATIAFDIIRLGICCMEKKQRSTTMLAMLAEFRAMGIFDILCFPQAMILNDDPRAWPTVDVMIAFFSSGFPLEKAVRYAKIHPHTFFLTQPASQVVLLDRRAFYTALKRNNVPVVRHIFCSRDGFEESSLPLHADTFRSVAPPPTADHGPPPQIKLQPSDAVLNEHGNPRGGHQEFPSSAASSPASLVRTTGGDRGALFLANPSTATTSPIVEEHEDYITINGERLDKPFVEKPASAEDHNIHIYYKGGGMRRLFRKVKDRSSEYLPGPHKIRREGSYVYEEFIETAGTQDVKCYTVGSNYVFAETRKAPTKDGVVIRREDGKEEREMVQLTGAEQMVARKVIKIFGQIVCGFDILRAKKKKQKRNQNHNSSTEGEETHSARSNNEEVGGEEEEEEEAFFVCDVNGWSFVKGVPEYVTTATRIMRDIFVEEVRKRGLHREFRSRTTQRELCGVVGVMRHADRTPKQKIKIMVNFEPLLIAIFSGQRKVESELIFKSGHPKLDVIEELVKQLLTSSDNESNDEHQQISSASGKIPAGIVSSLPCSPMLSFTTTCVQVSAGAPPGPPSQALRDGKPSKEKTDDNAAEDGTLSLGAGPSGCDSGGAGRDGDGGGNGDDDDAAGFPLIPITGEGLVWHSSIDMKPSGGTGIAASSGDDRLPSIPSDTLAQGALLAPAAPTTAAAAAATEELVKFEVRLGDNASRSVVHSLRLMRDVLSRKREGLKIQVKPKAWDAQGNCIEAQLVCKWGGWLTDAGHKQAETLGAHFTERVFFGDVKRKVMRENLRIKTNNERRVIHTGVEFARGLLRDPTIDDRICTVDEDLLGNTHAAKEQMAVYTDQLRRILHVTETNVDEDEWDRIVELPGMAQILSCPAIPEALRTGPRGALEAMHLLMRDMLEHLPDDLHEALYRGETVDLVRQRWENIYNAFYLKKTDTFDTTKIPDIYDYISYDACYNQEHFAPHDLYPLFILAEVLSTFVSDGEYGITGDEKLTSASLYARPLFNTIVTDLEEIAERKGPTLRMYFTSESHVCGLKNLLYFSPVEQFLALEEPMELHFLSHIVFKIYRYPPSASSSPDCTAEGAPTSASSAAATRAAPLEHLLTHQLSSLQSTPPIRSPHSERDGYDFDAEDAAFQASAPEVQSSGRTTPSPQTKKPEKGPGPATSLQSVVVVPKSTATSKVSAPVHNGPQYQVEVHFSLGIDTNMFGIVQEHHARYTAVTPMIRIHNNLDLPRMVAMSLATPQ